MSSDLLSACLEQFARHGFAPEFQSYFMRVRSRLLASGDVACEVAVLAAQEEDPSGGAHQILTLLLDEARMGVENDHADAEDFLETLEMAV